VTEDERQEAIATLDRMAGQANMLARLYEEAARMLDRPTVVERYFAEAN
jgi:hypothetical protein